MRRDVDRDEGIARPAVGTRPALPFQPDLLTAQQSGGNFDLDVLASRQMHPRLGALGGVGEIDGERGMQVLSRDGLAEILRLELGAGARAAAKHVAQDVFEATAAGAAATETTGAAAALETVRAEI